MVDNLMIPRLLYYYYYNLQFTRGNNLLGVCRGADTPLHTHYALLVIDCYCNSELGKGSQYLIKYLIGLNLGLYRPCLPAHCPKYLNFVLIVD